MHNLASPCDYRNSSTSYQCNPMHQQSSSVLNETYYYVGAHRVATKLLLKDNCLLQSGGRANSRATLSFLLGKKAGYKSDQSINGRQPKQLY